MRTKLWLLPFVAVALVFDGCARDDQHETTNKGRAEKPSGKQTASASNEDHQKQRQRNGEPPGQADTREQLSQPTGKEVPRLAGLQFEPIDDDTVLITGGFPYNKSFSMEIPFTIKVGNSGDIDKLAFSAVLVAGKVDSSGEYTAIPANSGKNIVWEFTESGTSFRVGKFVYTALRKGSTVRFTDKGVLLDGFRICPLSQWKTQD